MGHKISELCRRSTNQRNTCQQQTTTMNSIVMSSRKAVVARPANSRKSALRAVRNGSRTTMMSGMQVLRPEKKYECLSYLPDLTDEEISNQVFFAGPALYENRYWTMWKLPLFGCQSGDEVLAEIQNCQDEYPGY